jgi:hypothetical protein
MTGGKSRLGLGNADDLGPKSTQLAKAHDKLVPGNQVLVILRNPN